MVKHPVLEVPTGRVLTLGIKQSTFRLNTLATRSSCNIITVCLHNNPSPLKGQSNPTVKYVYQISKANKLGFGNRQGQS